MTAHQMLSRLPLGRNVWSLFEPFEWLNGSAPMNRTLELPVGVEHLLKSLVGAFLADPRLIVPIGTD
jgi:hypothetical protein